MSQRKWAQRQKTWPASQAPARSNDTALVMSRCFNPAYTELRGMFITYFSGSRTEFCAQQNKNHPSSYPGIMTVLWLRIRTWEQLNPCESMLESSFSLWQLSLESVFWKRRCINRPWKKKTNQNQQQNLHQQKEKTTKPQVLKILCLI